MEDSKQTSADLQGTSKAEDQGSSAEVTVTGNDQNFEVEIPNGDKKEEGPSSESVEQTPQNEKRTLTKEEKDSHAISVKMSALERERNEIKQRAQETREYARNAALMTTQEGLRQLNAEFERDPQKYERFRQAYRADTGIDPGDYSTLYQGSTNYQTSQVDKGPVYSPDEIRNIAEVTWELKKAKEALFTEFPDLDPKNIYTEEDAIVAKAKVQRALDVADIERKYNPHINYQEAVLNTIRSSPDYQDRQVKQAEIRGEMIGKAKAYGQNVGVSSGLSGGQSSSPNTIKVSMNSAQRAKYEELKSKDPKQAEYFARAIAGNLY